MSALPGLETYLDTEERDARPLRRGNLRELARRIRQQPGALGFGFALSMVGTAATLFEPWVFGLAIDRGIVPGRWDLLRELIAAYLGLVVVRVLAIIGQGYLFEVLGQAVTQKLRVELFSHLQRVPIQIFDRNPAGRLLTRVTNDISALNEMFSAGFVSLLSNLLLVFGIIAMLGVLDLQLAAAACLSLPVLVALTVKFSGRLRIAYREARSRLSALNAFLAENLIGIRVVNLFNRQPIHVDRFRRINQWYSEAQFGTVRIYALFQPAITVASGFALAAVIAYGAWRASHGTLALGVLVAFFAYVQLVFQPLRDIADKWNVFLSGMASAERVFSVLAWPTEMEARETMVPARRPDAEIRGDLRFENVWFAYQGESWVLKDLTLDVPAGSRLAVVGHTGAGKTTLISLLLRLYEPQKGRILLDGRDIREYDIRGLRALIGVIQQEPFLFSGTVADNVTFWGTLPGGAAGAEALFEAGTSGTRALVERGTNFSMGERQALAFARALAAQPSIWILDEATASMDSGSEERLQEAMERETAGRTTLLIAHRLATVRSADRIIVLHKGSLVEQGTHESLLASDGLYARLYRFQSAQERLVVEQK